SAPANGSRSSSKSGRNRLDPIGKRIREKSRGTIVEKELRRLEASELIVT
ncbi:hypothetical protein PanWU01x14_037540, partial [Parasponia andersonii]